MITLGQIMRSGQKPRVHPNGFIQVNLDDTSYTRIHVWPGDIVLAGQRTHLWHPVHDHVFHLKSTVLTGHLDNITYEFTPDDKGDHVLYQGIYRKRSDSTLRSLGRRGFLSANAVSTHSHLRNKTYELEPYVLHATLPRGTVMTLVETTRASLDRNPLIVVPMGVEVDNTYDRLSAYPENLLWLMIREAFEMAKESGKKERVA